MISVDEALKRLLGLVRPTGSEPIALAEARGRVLAREVGAQRDQPPFASSAMDGYALRGADAHPGARLRVVGESAAGRRFGGAVASGEAVRIFTGAPLPEGADRIVIQEDTARDEDFVVLGERLDPSPHVRAQGCDFAAGAAVSAPRILGPADIALLAAMNAPKITVAKRPAIAILSTGDELVLPGESPGPDQIVASNAFGLAALVEAAGAEARILPIAPDRLDAVEAALGLASEADLAVTIGGASVGEHDLVAEAGGRLGLQLAFHGVRMRPGKPLMAGRIGDAAFVGLPGNPVSALVCGHVFLAPAVRTMLGLGASAAPRLKARLAADMPQGGPREHYMRATAAEGEIAPNDLQDSSLLSVLASANALLIRPANDPPRSRGDAVDFIPLESPHPPAAAAADAGLPA